MHPARSSRSRSLAVLLALGVRALMVAVALLGVSWSPGVVTAEPPPAPAAHPLMLQSAETAAAGSRGCLSCHLGVEKMHASPAVQLSCVDCHGGDASARVADGDEPGSEAYRRVREQAHVAPRFPQRWAGADGEPSSANPVRSYTLLNDESPEFIRFVNPGDLRVAGETCGPCHDGHVDAVIKSPMTTSAIFWAAAAYANGIVGPKSAFLGESYAADGTAQGLVDHPTEEERARGAVERLLPLPRWEVVQPGEYFRAFERGGLLQPSFFPEIGNPSPFDEPGRPDIRVSNRGRGTGLRISPAVINLHKTRLNDPHLSFLGTNDHPGDYRSSGCTACHVVYANDREPLHSGPWAEYGHRGTSASADPTIPRGESGHPVAHRLTRAVPTSQCMSCHMHQPNAFVNTYLGYTMWDYETDGEHLWPEQQRNPTAAERRAALEANPEGAVVRGLWSDPEVLAAVSELNPDLQHTQFADYHGHGWIFRAVFSRDRAGRLLDGDGEVVPFDDPERFARAVHLKDIHLERGMHCVDCHFSQDVHGDGNLYGEYGDAIEIECSDCHGSAAQRATLRTTGPAAPAGGTDLSLANTPWGQRRFRWRGDTLVQRSMLDPDLEWEVVQVQDTVTPGHPRYNPRSRRAKLMTTDGTWLEADEASVNRALGAEPARLAHRDERMTCYSCHSSWVTSCFGCHLPQEANVRSKMNHYEGTETRNYASYNPQVIRTDVYMLGLNGATKGGRIAPLRSSSALVLSSTNANRKRFYTQQPPISRPGFSSQAFNPHVPHTVRSAETKGCSDCHLSEDGDNNAWMAQLLTLGTGFVNFIGHNAWVAEGHHGLEAVTVTEWEEPQAVLGSYLHRLAYPDDFQHHRDEDLVLHHGHHHDGGGGEVVDLQLRGEYLYTAKGHGGFEVFDVANIDNAEFSERIVTAPVSPLGQRTAVATADAAAVALPTNMPMAFDRTPPPEALEQPIHPIYRYAFVADRQEGLVLVDVATLTDGEPRNNFLERALTYNPQGRLDGAAALTVAGTWVYVLSDAGLVVLDFNQPLEPRVAAVLPGFAEPTAVAVQFRYAFITGAEGLSVVDITDPENPILAARLEETGKAWSVYPARTYAYVAAGERGLFVVDIERPESPRVDQVVSGFTDARDVQIGATNASLFAYVADGAGGLKVLQLTSPETVPGYLGFSPRPAPQLIAVYPTEGEALALSRGLDRDRAVDESGHQVSVFNRIGARPFNRAEMERLFLRDGEIFTVGDDPGEEEPSAATSAATAETPSVPTAPARR
ncbi:MAG: hypothetical protein SX243_00895 [Acidobacteriota bacterium]|nr:hypothetical protein [Acidobacteriota bacterium]